MLCAGPQLISLGKFAQPVPAGVVVGYDGTIASLAAWPAWTLCDGGNGTPDLRDRFILGAGGGYIAGQTGGAKTGQLTGTTSTDGAHGNIGGGGGTSSGSDYSRGLAGGHSHVVTGDMDWVPPSQQLVYIMATTTAKIPPGAVAWSFAAPAGGWTRQAAYDGRFILGRGDDARGATGLDIRTLRNILLSTAGVHVHPRQGGYAAGGNTHQNTGAGGHTHANPADMSITVPKPPYMGLYVVRTGAANGGRAGLILAYTGTVAALPSNWVVCDGTNGTPDLGGRMPIGADDAAITLGAVGGSATAVAVTGGALASVTTTHNHDSGGAALSGGANDHSSYAWTHAHTGWSGAAASMPPYAVLTFIMFKG